MHIVFHHRVPRRLVERCHHAVHQRLVLLGKHIYLLCRGKHADADGFRQQKNVARLCAGVGQNLIRVHEARHSEAVFGLVIVDAVAARDERAGFVDLVVPAAQQRMHCVHGHGFRNGHNVQAELRFAAHGIHIGKRVRRRDLAEKIRIIRDRREEIHRLHQSEFIADLIDRGIIAFVKTNEQVRIVVHPDPFQQFRKHARAHLCAAPGALCKLCKLDIRRFHFLLLFMCPRLFPPRRFIVSNPRRDCNGI